MENDIKKCMYCKYMTTSYFDEPCKSCGSCKSNWVDASAPDNIQRCCSNCKFLMKGLPESPCSSCDMYSKWEPKKGRFKPGDLVVLKNGNYTSRKNIYIYLRNNWALRVPTYVLLSSECDYCFSTFIDKLIVDNKASWAFNYEYASSEDISTHDNRANDLYRTETLNKWFSELIGETEKKDFREISFQMRNIPYMIKDVIFSDPATIIFWEDGTKTVVKTQDGEKYDKEKGFAMAVCKKVFGNERDYYNVFKRWMRKGKEVKKEEKC